MAVCSTIQSQVRPMFLSECLKHYLASEERRKPAGGAGELSLAQLPNLAWFLALLLALLLHQFATWRLALLLTRAGLHVGFSWIQVPGYLERRCDDAPLATQRSARRLLKLLRYSLWAVVALLALPLLIGIYAQSPSTIGGAP